MLFIDTYYDSETYVAKTNAAAISKCLENGIHAIVHLHNVNIDNYVGSMFLPVLWCGEDVEEPGYYTIKVLNCEDDTTSADGFFTFTLADGGDLEPIG